MTTFHRLCELLGAEAGVLPARPEPIPEAWWDETLPGALEAAIDAMPAGRYHAVVVDECQDFDSRWFALLQRLLVDPDDVFWVFHDPGQALIRADIVAGLGLVHQITEGGYDRQYAADGLFELIERFEEQVADQNWRATASTSSSTSA